MNEDKWQKARPPTGPIGQSNRNKLRRMRPVRYTLDKKGQVKWDCRDIQTSGVLTKTKDGDYVPVNRYHVSGMYGDKTLGRGLPPMQKTACRHTTRFSGSFKGSGTNYTHYVKRLKAIAVRLEEKRRSVGLTSDEKDRFQSTIVTLETYGVGRQEVNDILYKTLGKAKS